MPEGTTGRLANRQDKTRGAFFKQRIDALSGSERVCGESEVPEERPEVVAIAEWVQIGIRAVIFERLDPPGGRLSQRGHRTITIASAVLDVASGSRLSEAGGIRSARQQAMW